jgi:hypothetical protein
VTGPAEDAQTTVQAVQENADRLGLIWKRRPATITSAASGAVTGVLDADSEPIALIPMVGSVYVGQRVYVDIVPPSGNFIVGSVGSATVGADVARVAAQALPNGAATLISWDTSTTDSSGFVGTLPTTSVTIPPGLDGLYTLTVSVAMTASGTRNFVTIFVNGVRFVRSSLDPGEDFIGVAGTRMLVAGDVITVDAFQNSGGAATMTGQLRLFRIG